MFLLNIQKDKSLRIRSLKQCVSHNQEKPSSICVHSVYSEYGLESLFQEGHGYNLAMAKAIGQLCLLKSEKSVS